MSNVLQIRPMDELSQWQIIREQATTLMKSGFLPQSIKTPEAALAIILTGRELGIGTMAALRTIQVIQGTPTIPPQLMLALINHTKELEDLSITDNGQACTVTMKRKGRRPHSETFSMQDAALMKTTEYAGGEKKTISLSEKYNWKQQPKTMRKWRAVAACARVVFPDVTLGLYTTEEMGGDVIEATLEPESVPIETEELKQPTVKKVRFASSEDDLADEFFKRGRAAGVAIDDLRQTAASVHEQVMTWTEAIESLPEA